MLGNVLFEMFFFGYRLHTTKNISPSPTLQFGGVFYIDVDQGSLINKKKLKNSLYFLIVCGGCADLMPFSTNLCKKKTFLSTTERFGSFLFCFFYSNLGLPSAKSLQNERLGSCPVAEKIEPVTTHKMASYLMDVNIIFQEKYVFDQS